jgi:FxsC-like protein
MLFFFSYARADLSPFLKRFYSDLKEAVRSKSGEAPDRIAFRDAISIEPGKPWSDVITNALRVCKVFVYLHTPTYFTRDGCGKEFRVIKNRVAVLSEHVTELGQASCIQPVYWDGEKQLINVPTEVARIQLCHEDYGEDYSRRGMLQICRASPGTQAYWNVVNAIAQRIQTAAQNAPLPELRDSLIWENISSLFPLAAPANASEPIAPNNPIRPPRYARFVWIVGRRDEIAQTRCVECLECYDSDGIAEEWRPFLPDSSDPARLIATDAAREAQLGYRCELTPQNQKELVNLIEQAGDTYTPVVVVTDLWSLRLARYRAVVSVFERGTLDNCAVIFPWNLKDHDTNTNNIELKRMLAEIFPVQFHKPKTSLLFEEIFDVSTFKAELSKLLTKYVADISRSMKAARALPEASTFKAPPQLGPISTLT